MKKFFNVASLALILCLSGIINGQIVKVPTDPGTSSTSISEEQLQQLQGTLAKLAASLEQLRELAGDGLVPQDEVEAAEKDLESTRTQVADIEARIESQKQLAAEQTRVKTLVKPVLKSINISGPTVMRSTTGNWSLKNIDRVQNFFVNSFGRPLPISTFGQSATHNRLRWNHRNSVDVGVHPDSPEGRALMIYLQESNIPFLAFRGAVPGVSTGPHIHIGFPSHRIG
jgi:hypothetical protein